MALQAPAEMEEAIEEVEEDTEDNIKMVSNAQIKDIRGFCY